MTSCVPNDLTKNNLFHARYGDLFHNVEVHNEGEWWEILMKEIKDPFMYDLLKPEGKLHPNEAHGHHQGSLERPAAG
jgi:hypothetical protein